MDKGSGNPLEQPSQVAWDRLILAANPPALLVAIGGMLGARLSEQVEPEDVLQETLLRAWRDRRQFEWRGPAAFRLWLLQIARNRVRDLADHLGARKRGEARVRRAADLAPLASAWEGAGASTAGYAGPQLTTTPSRVAADRELAAGLQRALDQVPVEWREVVRLRLFEERDFAAIASSTGLGVEGVRYRFRHGAEAYRRALRKARLVDPSGH